MKTITSITKLVVFALSITIFTLPVLAQNTKKPNTKKPNTQQPKNDPGACYMVTSSGKNVSLGSLCGIKEVQPTNINSKVFKVPIKTRIHKTPVITVKFNNNKPFDMILDTGASGILVTQAMAKALNLKPEGKVRVAIADGSIVLLDTAFVSKVSVGGVTVNNTMVTIAPKADIGLLGHAFFENYDIKILEKEVEFHKR